MMLYILLCHRDQWFLWGRRHLLCPEGQKGVGEKSWNLVPSIFLSHLTEITKYYLPLHPVAPLAPECPLAQSLLEAPVTKPDNYLHTHSSELYKAFFFLVQLLKCLILFVLENMTSIMNSIMTTIFPASLTNSSVLISADFYYHTTKKPKYVGGLCVFTVMSITMPFFQLVVGRLFQNGSWGSDHWLDKSGRIDLMMKERWIKWCHWLLCYNYWLDHIYIRSASNTGYTWYQNKTYLYLLLKAVLS